MTNSSVTREHVDSISDNLIIYETKSKERFSHLEKSIQGLTQKMDARAMAGLRPQMDTSGIEETKESSGFNAYIRKGDEGFLESKSMSGSSDPDGGYLVPDTLSKEIQTKLTEFSFFRNLAKTTHISSDVFESLVSDKDLDVGWTQEVGAHGETDTPSFQKIRIPVHEIYARPRATQRLIDDASVDIESWITQQISEQMAQKETAAFINGDGNGKPTGFLTYALNADKSLQLVKTGSDGGFSEEHPEYALFDMVHALKSAYLGKAAWVMSRSAEAAIRKMRDPNQMHYLWQPPVGSGKKATLLGYPVYVSDHMPKVENQSLSVAFGNFYEAYHIIDRQDVRLLRDPYSAKPFVEFYTTKRVGGDLVNNEALSVLNFAK
jgi:HK97 family phage major capsid protein